jgi:hypothetical protein
MRDRRSAALGADRLFGRQMMTDQIVELIRHPRFCHGRVLLNGDPSPQRKNRAIARFCQSSKRR